MILGKIENERQKRINFLNSPKYKYINEIKKKNSAFDFVDSLEYKHPGLTKIGYLAHPYRLTSIYKSYCKWNIEGIVLAALHNVLEVSDVNPLLIIEKFGQNTYDAINVLTVDRKLEKDMQYKKEYYERIFSSKKYVGQIKIIDKLDNLFTLCLNKDDNSREEYIKEINIFLLPKIEAYVPNLKQYFELLIDDCITIGYHNDLKVS